MASSGRVSALGDLFCLAQISLMAGTGGFAACFISTHAARRCRHDDTWVGKLVTACADAGVPSRMRVATTVHLCAYFAVWLPSRPIMLPRLSLDCMLDRSAKFVSARLFRMHACMESCFVLATAAVQQ